ncbi:MAG: NAD+ synthase [Planctomycetota bacterium]
MGAMRLALCQINPTIGELDANVELILRFAGVAAGAGVELVVFPELSISGYPPKDLLLQEGFIPACGAAARQIAARAPGNLWVVVGCPMPAREPHMTGGPIANSLLVCHAGTIVARYDKRLLPTYDVFDEDRYFTPGNSPVVIDVPTRLGPVRVGLSICEDLWKGEDAGFAQRYLDSADPVAGLVAAGATIIINPSASPFVLGKGAKHRDILRCHARRHKIVVAAVNQVGGNDDLIFDGHAAVFDPLGNLIAAGPGFEEGLTIVDIGVDGLLSLDAAPLLDPLLSASDESLAYRALVLGVRDYCRKTGFKKALLGLSGGIDSALTVVIAAAALGPTNVLGVAMPGPYSSDHALSDARESASRLGSPFMVVPIEPPMAGFRSVLDPAMQSAGFDALGRTLPDLTEENIQSRLRGTALMALSNRTGAIVLTTGNKSELAVGYCTLYGDMNGGLAVLSDVSKDLVYRLARWINANPASLGIPGLTRPPIPESSIDKAPSAELRPNQTDQDSLPPYDTLDRIIELYVEKRQSPSTIVTQTGFDPATVNRCCRLIDLSEYKRKQAAVGLKLTTVAFGSGRRVPIAQRWRPWA